jgi:hypothetical protein
MDLKAVEILNMGLLEVFKMDKDVVLDYMICYNKKMRHEYDVNTAKDNKQTKD